MLPIHCPSCGHTLKVKRLVCENCVTEVEGLYPLPVLARLSKEDQEFILQFIKSSGSLKDIAKIIGVSYPTVRNKLDGIIEKINEETWSD